MKTSSFSCVPRLVSAINLLALTWSDTPPPPTRSRGQPAGSGHLCGRTRQLALTAIFIHHWDTPAVNFLPCDWAGRREGSDPHVALAEITALSARAENTSLLALLQRYGSPTAPFPPEAPFPSHMESRGSIIPVYKLFLEH